VHGLTLRWNGGIKTIGCDEFSCLPPHNFTVVLRYSPVKAIQPSYLLVFEAKPPNVAAEVASVKADERLELQFNSSDFD
jgi:hypothetical protein